MSGTNLTDTQVLALTSVRFKHMHTDTEKAYSEDPSTSIREFHSINAAKKESRKLGGAGKVKTCKTLKEAKELLTRYGKLRDEQEIRILTNKINEVEAQLVEAIKQEKPDDEEIKRLQDLSLKLQTKRHDLIEGVRNGR